MEGGTDNHHPDSLYQAGLDDVAYDLMGLIHQVRPHVVITHDLSGGYFHPDHIKVSQAVSLAWDRTGDARLRKGNGADVDEPWQPERLYYSVIPRSAVKWFIRLARLLRQDPHHFGQNNDIDLTEVGMPNEQIHVRLDVGAFAAVKEQASACHRSQGGGGALRLVPSFLRRRFLRYEYFAQARPLGAGRHLDLFEDIEYTA
jgi:LmbE family N-acetylglucosaminyl deacetylase